MPFPVAFEQTTCATPQELAQQLAAAARSPEAPRPWERVLWLVEADRLTRAEAVALSAAFLQQPEAALLCEGARLAARLGDPRLGALALAAADAHDPTVLLASDPTDLARSAEDALLAAAAAAIDPSDDDLRGRLLEHLRNAGLPELEVPLLVGHGSAEEIARWLPAVFAEGLRPEHVSVVRARLARADDGARAVEEALAALDEDTRAAITSA